MLDFYVRFWAWRAYTDDMTSDDMTLVREYAQSNSEQAFATLVSRHVNLVYSVALRQVRDPQLAEEITQGVFIILAKKAKSVDPKTILCGWLCRTTRYVSAHALRSQRRRQLRDHEARMQSIANEPDAGGWNQIAPMLDEALNRLGEKEHDAVVLRFFDGKGLREVGEAMGTTEDAARMRVNRGLENLRRFFTKQGVTLPTTAIAGAVAANSVQAAPIGLAAAITAGALSGTTITMAAVFSAMNSITMTTLQKTIVTAAVVVLTGGGIYEARQVATLREQVQTLQQKLAITNPSQESEGGSQLNLSAIKEKLPETVTPLTPDQLATKEPHSYEFGTGSSGRVWQRIDDATWHEVYPDGFTSIFKVLGHAKVGDTEGTLVAKVGGDLKRTGTPNDGTLQAFIPDRGSERMHHLFRYASGGDMSWHDLAEMNQVQ